MCLDIMNGESKFQLSISDVFEELLKFKLFCYVLEVHANWFGRLWNCGKLIIFFESFSNVRKTILLLNSRAGELSTDWLQGHWKCHPHCESWDFWKCLTLRFQEFYTGEWLYWVCFPIIFWQDNNYQQRHLQQP